MTGTASRILRGCAGRRAFGSYEVQSREPEARRALLFLRSINDALAVRIQVSEPVAGRLGDGLRIPDGRTAPVLDRVDHDLHAVLETDRRVPVELASDLPGVGERAVRLAGPLRQVGYISLEQLDQAVYAVGAPGPDVEDLALDRGAGRLDEGIGHVGDEGEIPGLRTIADHG